MSDPNNIPSWPRISIITPSFNQGQFIEETIKSVVEQGYPNLEYIVIDGGSSDQTTEIIRRYEDAIDHWVSEEDNGQSHAINKGLEHATGDIIQWINSDDILLPGSLELIAKAFMTNPSCNLVAGKTIKFGDDKKEQIVPRQLQHNSFEDFVLNAWFMQPSCFFRADVFRALSPLNQDLHFTMDTDLFVRYFLKFGKENILQIQDPLVRFRMHDDSKTFSSQLKFYGERFQIDLNILNSCGVKPPENLGAIIEKRIPLEDYHVSHTIDGPLLSSTFHKKWNAWIVDASKRYREVADHAGLHGDIMTMRQFSWKAIQANPLKLINYRYWLHTFKG